jgi:hypothetical protein
MSELILNNPITNNISKSIESSRNVLNFAVPYISSFALTIIKKDVNQIKDKRLITRFEETSINTFDLPTLKQLIELGFQVRFDNNIHLKLYITDNETYVTSSNLTKGGFETNIELTVKVKDDNVTNCVKIFNEIWENAKDNVITLELIEQNWDKYEIIKKREKYASKKKDSISTVQIQTGEINISELIDAIFKQKNDYTSKLQNSYEAYKKKEKLKESLKKGFNFELFYVPLNQPKGRDNLAYDLLYGYEKKLAGTGFLQTQLVEVFENPLFKDVIAYMFPESVGQSPWNFENNDEFREFCNGIFDFDIPRYKISIPIRLASYFYPNYFIQIFKLDELKKVCDAFGIVTDAKTNGDLLYVYNREILSKMSVLPYDTYICSQIAYEIIVTVDLYKRLKLGESYKNIEEDYSKKKWRLMLLKKAFNLLRNLKIIKATEI